MRKQSENNDIPQEPENQVCSYFNFFNFYFAFLVNIIDNILQLVGKVCITSPNLQPMAMLYHCHIMQLAVQYHCHMIQTKIT